MTATFNGKGPVKKGGATKPEGKPVQQTPRPIQSKASEAKRQGGSADAGSGIGNT